MLNWLVWNRTVLMFKCVLMLNGTAWNTAVSTCKQYTLKGICFLCETELFKIELFWHSIECKYYLHLY